MKKFIFTTAISLTLTASFSAVYASQIPANKSFPHILSTVQFPQIKWGTVRHTFKLEIPQNSSAITQINIDVPPGLSVKNNFSISDQSGRKIQANTTVNDRKITIAFAQLVAPANILNIDMNRVNRTGTSNAWLYRVSAKFVGSDAEIPVGVAQFRIY
ncbi:DUF2808 domain-containing protein [Nostoc favosum]|uniref:DUF2808 domain-containing protein n=1 Tax=Nostoc favosum CHAB5714 TaxID=2780399 RepID=A0ABS8I1A8_9NOSO|nr:DUF2808 domain-containing protein [Nostoc favosum]MCC5597741.1 DUF2808 domain-containing protein [Nostoc favosum CHAB5714]